MTPIITIVCLTSLCIILTLAFVVAINSKAGKTVKSVFIGVSIVFAGVAVWTTLFLQYYWDANTRVLGWPVPSVIFQRDNAALLWLDYVGIMTVLSLPTNYLLFMFVPSLAVLSAAGIARWKKPTKAAQPISPE